MNQFLEWWLSTEMACKLLMLFLISVCSVCLDLLHVVPAFLLLIRRLFLIGCCPCNSMCNWSVCGVPAEGRVDDNNMQSRTVCNSGCVHAVLRGPAPHTAGWSIRSAQVVCAARWVSVCVCVWRLGRSLSKNHCLSWFVTVCSWGGSCSLHVHGAHADMLQTMNSWPGQVLTVWRI